MIAPLLAWLTDATALEWLDVAALIVGAFGIWGIVAALLPRWFAYPPFWLFITTFFWARHLVFATLTRIFYQLRWYGREHVPASGPVLLLSNHVSYLDWMLLWVASPRPIRFVVWAKYFDNPFLGLVLRKVRAIPIDGSAGPHALARSFQTISEVLSNGEMVCIFAEARLTRNGRMLPFQRGFEKILRRVPAPIVPACIFGMWGSIFSYYGGRIITKWPQSLLGMRVLVKFGKPLPPTTTAPEVRQVIQELSAELANRDSYRLLAPHRQAVRMATRYPFRVSMIDTSTPTPRVLSLGRVLAGSMCLAQWIAPRTKDQPIVGIWLPSSVGSALANLALALLGKTSVNLNYTAGNDATGAAIRQTGMKQILTSKRFLQRMPLDPGEGVELLILEDALAAIRDTQRILAFLKVLICTVLFYPLGVLWREVPGWVFETLFVPRLRQDRLDQTTTIIFSSGSTGEPKGVMLSHRNIAGNVRSIVETLDLVPQDRLLGVLPLFHSFGYTATFWLPLQIGASVVYYPDPRQAKEVGELAKKWQCTGLLSTATFLRFYLRRCETDDFRSLRLLVCGAEKLPASLAKEFQAKFGILPLEGYGCTELSPVVSVNTEDVDLNGVKQIANKIGTIGQPLVGVAVRVVDPDTLQPLPIGQEGLILATGPNVMVGYLNKPEQTAKILRDGWYVTGDMGKLDEEGFITITGRLSRFAKIGGEMVPLERLEEEMHDAFTLHERVFAVTAVADEKRGERLIVLHLPMPTGITPKAICDKLSERGLPNLWVPSERDFIPVAEMPVLGSGKLDLRRVKQLAEQLVLGHNG